MIIIKFDNWFITLLSRIDYSYVVWSGQEKSPPIKSMIVNINEILKTEFILFEDVYFDYIK